MDEYQPLASVAARVMAVLVVLVLPLLVWAIGLRRRNVALEAERAQAQQQEDDPCLRHVQAQERD
ncbi:hypothetical protein CTI14_54110 [Methylobacterium radiotolerans]|nr:hypothetical protein CTI14_54110 [Methylobacterium radiotolerans]